ncbi:MAG TPA: ABC transporter permease subunit [Polyangiales bacterium]|nr:ABC transporter permease subunit [Polyangiales bacterium]
MTVRRDSAVRALLRLELADALRSRWLLFTAGTYLVVFGAFVWLGLRESSVLGFTGVSRVVLNLANVVVVVLPLVALVATTQTVVRGRSSGFFELFLTQPCRRSAWIVAAISCRMLVVAGPLVGLLLLAAGVGWLRGEEAIAGLVLRSLGVSCALSLAFLGLGTWLSTLARTSERAIVYALVAWLGVSMLHDFALMGVLLQWHLPAQLVFALAALNPVETARLALLGVVDPELSLLGPVGFWLTTTLGTSGVLALGIAWPALLGAASAWAARIRFEHMDLVG